MGREGNGVKTSGAERTPRQPSDQSPTNSITRIRAARGVEPQREPERIMLESGKESRSQMVENCVNLKAGRQPTMGKSGSKPGSFRWGAAAAANSRLRACRQTQTAIVETGSLTKGREQVRTRRGRPKEQEEEEHE
ncbi:hypothetical protein Mapa_008053 [Marchantia paleacea]|nr:hypothetical protein Mapa_008053 [Marchantia paleacea]